jgi:hypothetical protein
MDNKNVKHLYTTAQKNPNEPLQSAFLVNDPSTGKEEILTYEITDPIAFFEWCDKNATLLTQESGKRSGGRVSGISEQRRTGS